MAYQLIWEEKGLWARCAGQLTDSELSELKYEFYGHERFSSIRYLLADFLDVDDFAVTEHAVRLIAATDRAAALKNSDIMLAILTLRVSTLEKAFLYQDATEGIPWKISFFDKIADARLWVGQ